MEIEDSTKEDLRCELEHALDAVERHQGDVERQDRLAEELRVHQVELELQNRSLREGQALLEESRSRYADLYDFAPVAYLTLDATGRIVEINLTGCTMLGSERAVALGAPFASMVDLEDASRFWSHLRRCAEEKKSVTTELGFRARSAGPVHVQMVSVPVLDLGGRAVAFRTSFTDITARVKAELDLQRVSDSERRLRLRIEALERAAAAVSRALALVGSSPLPIFLQVVADEARRLAGAEFAALETETGTDPSLGSIVVAGIEPTQAGPIGGLLRGLGVLDQVAEGQSLRLPDLQRHPSFECLPRGQPAVTSFLGVPISYGGKMLASLCLANKRAAAEFSAEDQRDVEALAERAGHAIEVARLTEQTMQALRARDNLLAIVSHDLRSPLSAIRMSATLQTQSAPKTGERRSGRKQLDVILRSSDRMERLLGDLLQASAIESGPLALDARSVAVAPLVEELFETLEPAAALKRIRMERDVPHGLPELVCDYGRILQVLLNLVGNAIKFTPEDGTIRVTVARTNLAVRFSVSDTGPGIGQEEQPHIFDRYWKGKPSGRHGSGLGLYIAKGIIDAHGGDIYLNSRLGVGTTFHFTLPVYRDADER